MRGCCLALLFLFAAVSELPAQSGEKKEIGVLILQLGDASFSIRDRAMQTLEAIGEPVLAAVREAASKHPNLEGRRRAAQLVERIEEKMYAELDQFAGPSPNYRMQIKLSHDGKTLLVASYRDVHVWDLASRKVRWKWEGHLDEVQDMDFTHDDKFAVIGCGSVSSNDFGVRVWNLETGKRDQLLAGHKGWVHGVATSPTSSLLLSAGHDGSMRVWDLAKGEQTRTIKETSTDGPLSFVRSAEWSPDGKLWACHNSYAVFLWDADTGKDLRKLQMDGPSVLGRPIVCLRFSPDSKLLAVAGGHLTGSTNRRRPEKNLTLYEVATGKEVAALEAHTLQVAAVSFSRDGRRLASAGLDNTMRLWDVATGRLLRTYRAPDLLANGQVSPGQCYSVEIAHDGRSAYVATRDGIVRRFRLPD